MENNLKYIVYCTTNTINKKIYIGVHKTNPNIFDGYLGNGCYNNKPSTYANPKTKFQYALKKYGVHNFIRTTIQIFDNEIDAYQLEELIVNKEFLKRKDVYNMITGGYSGIGSLVSIPTYQYDKQGNFIKEYDSIKSASVSINRNFCSVWRAIQTKGLCAGYFFTETKYEKLDLSLMKQYEGIHKTPVFQYSATGEYECCYDSIKDASRVLNINDSNLGAAIKLGIMCNNKYFLSVYEPQFSNAKSKQQRNTMIYQYDLEGNYIAEYKGMSEAKKALGIKSDIYKAIRLGRTAGDFQWSFEKIEKMEPIKPKSGKARRIGKYDLNGNLVKEYKSLAECKKENGSGMIHVLDGRDKAAKGYVYKYLS
jgi:hypothetical protein